MRGGRPTCIPIRGHHELRTNYFLSVSTLDCRNIILAYRETENGARHCQKPGRKFARCKKGGEEKVAGQKMGSSYDKTANRGERGEGRGERALPRFASSPLVSHFRECFFGLSRDALSASIPSLPSPPRSPISLPPSRETQFRPLKSIVLRGALQRGKKVVRRGRKRGDRGREGTGE